MERDNRRLYSSMRFEGDGVTKVVALTFELREGDGLSVDFGYGLVESGYIIDYDSQPVLIIFDEPLPKDQTITIRRLTQISEVPHVFQKTGNAQGGSPFNAKNIDENFENITRASQDAMDSQTLASETLEDMSGIKDDALKYRNEAEGFRNEAEVFRDSAIVKADEASISAGKAKTSEVNAKTSETNAKHSEEEAKRWAEEAQEVVVGDILIEGEGDSTTKAMTQKSVTDALNKKWDIQVTTGTGNVARMSEVDKKRGLYDFVFERPRDPFIQLRGTELTGAGARINIVNDNGTMGFVYRDQSGVDNHHVITVRKKSGDVALTSDIDVSNPIGTIQAYIGKTAPNDKWLLCRGQAFSAGSYPALAQLLPDLKIPDLRGVVLRGLDANRGFDPNRALLSYQEDAMQKITGEFTAREIEASSKVDIGGYKGAFKDGGIFVRYGARKAVASGDPMGGTISSFDSSLVARSNSQNETVMKNVAVNFIIKAR